MNIGSVGQSPASAHALQQSGSNSSGAQNSSSGKSVDPEGALASATNSFMLSLIKNSLNMHMQLFDFAKQQLDEEKDDG